VRLISFSVSLPGASYFIAWKASVVELTTGGFLAVLGPSIFFLLTFYIVRASSCRRNVLLSMVVEAHSETESLKGEVDISNHVTKKHIERLQKLKRMVGEIETRVVATKKTQSSGVKMIALLTLLIILSVAVLVICLFSNDFPFVIVEGMGGFLAFRVAQAAYNSSNKFPYGLIDLTPSVAIILAMTIIGFGGSSWITGLSVGRYTFENINVNDGKYVRLGEADGKIYLRSCDGGKRTLEIEDPRVKTVDFDGSPLGSNPSLWDLLHGRRYKFGLLSSC